MRSTPLISLAAVVAMFALSGPPHEAPAAPTNLAPANPAPNNDTAMRAEIERLTAELAAAQSNHEQVTVAPVPSPARAVAVSGEGTAAAGCAGGNCAVPRARSQAASQSRSWQPLRRVRGIFRR